MVACMAWCTLCLFPCQTLSLHSNLAAVHDFSTSWRKTFRINTCVQGSCWCLGTSLPDSYPGMKLQPSPTRNTLGRAQIWLKAREVFHWAQWAPPPSCPLQNQHRHWNESNWPELASKDEFWHTVRSKLPANDKQWMGMSFCIFFLNFIFQKQCLREGPGVANPQPQSNNTALKTALFFGHLLCSCWKSGLMFQTHFRGVAPTTGCQAGEWRRKGAELFPQNRPKNWVMALHNASSTSFFPTPQAQRAGSTLIKC